MLITELAVPASVTEGMAWFGQCLWIQDAKPDTAKPSGQGEQAQNTHPQGHVQHLCQRHYIITNGGGGDILTLMHFCKFCISVQNSVVCFALP